MGRGQNQYGNWFVLEMELAIPVFCSSVTTSPHKCVRILARRLKRTFQSASQHDKVMGRKALSGTLYPKRPTNGPVATQGKKVYGDESKGHCSVNITIKATGDRLPKPEGGLKLRKRIW